MKNEEIWRKLLHFLTLSSPLRHSQGKLAGSVGLGVCRAHAPTGRNGFVLLGLEQTNRTCQEEIVDHTGAEPGKKGRKALSLILWLSFSRLTAPWRTVPDEYGHWAGQDHPGVKVQDKPVEENQGFHFIPACPMGAGRIQIAFTPGSQNHGAGLGQSCNRNDYNRNFTIMLPLLVPPSPNQNSLADRPISLSRSMNVKDLIS